MHPFCGSVKLSAIYLSCFLLILGSVLFTRVSSRNSKKKIIYLNYVIMTNQSRPNYLPFEESDTSSRNGNYKVRLQSLLVRATEANVGLEFLQRIRNNSYHKYTGWTPDFVVSDIINQDLAFYTSQFKVPLLGCSRSQDVPKGIGIDEPIWVAPPLAKELNTLIKFSIVNRHSKAIIFILYHHLCIILKNGLEQHSRFPFLFYQINTQEDLDKLSDEEIVNINNSKEKSYFCVNITTSLLLHAFQRVEHLAGEKMMILFPSLIFDEISIIHTELKAELERRNSFVSLPLDRASMYSSKDDGARFDTTCLRRPVEYIKAITQGDKLCNWTEVYQMQERYPLSRATKFALSCLNFGNNYRRKRVMLTETMEMGEYVFRYIQGIFEGNYVLRLSNDNKPKTNMALGLFKNVYTPLTHHFKVRARLGAPIIMVRNVTENEECPQDFSMECTMYSQDRLTKTRMCCFGLGIDTLKKMKKLENSAAEFNVEKDAVESYLYKSKYTFDIEVLSGVNLIDGDLNVFLGNASHPSNLILKELNNGDIDMMIGPGVIVSSENLKLAHITKSFYDTAIGIMISRKEMLSGYLAFTAFLAPFDWSMWFSIFMTINVAAISTVIYEWLSPYGLTPWGRNRSRVFSFSSALNLCWSVLFSHTVATKSPKCWSSRFLMNVYACFCLVFLATYTANLAAYMVGEKSIRDIQGIHDSEIADGSLTIGTIAGSGTELYLRKVYSHVYNQALLFRNCEEAVEGLRTRKIEALVYDVEALNFYRGLNYRDRFEIVGKPFSQVSYTIALSKELGKYGEMLAQVLSDLFDSEGFKNFNTKRVKLWTKEVTGFGRPDLWPSDRLTTVNFAGPLLLLVAGIVVGFLTLLFETMFFHVFLPRLRRFKWKGWALPISQRLYRHLHAVPNYNKYAFTERHKEDIVRPIAERLSNHHRLSLETSFNITKLLSSRCSSYLSDLPVQNKVDSHELQVRRIGPCCPYYEHCSSCNNQGCSSCSYDQSESESLNVPLNNESASTQCFLNTFYKSPTSTNQRSNARYLSMLKTDFLLKSPTPLLSRNRPPQPSHEHHNIAVQTEIETLVNDRLQPVDANITLRTIEFERDMRQMREQIAKLMWDKEQLLMKLEAYEGRTRSSIEQEIQKMSGQNALISFSDSQSSYGGKKSSSQLLTCKNSW